MQENKIHFPNNYVGLSKLKLSIKIGGFQFYEFIPATISRIDQNPAVYSK